MGHSPRRQSLRLKNRSLGPKESNSVGQYNGRGSPRKNVKTALQSPKKAKLASAHKQTRGRKKANLSHLINFPLDVWFEIFSLLTPADLVTLTRTSKAMRETLMSRKSVTVWRAAARNQEPDIPRCPQDMSEPAWANLLFGGFACQTCGSHVRSISFTLRRRICAFCIKANLLPRRRMMARYPDVVPRLFDLIPCTTSRGLYYDRSRQFERDKHFWSPDVEAVASSLASYQEDVRAQKVGAMQALEDFNRARLRLVSDLATNVFACEIWHNKFILQRSKQSRIAARREAIKARFLELGYTESDLRDLGHHPEVNRTTELTDRIWNKIRPVLECDVKTRKAQRESQFCGYCPCERVIVWE